MLVNVGNQMYYIIPVLRNLANGEFIEYKKRRITVNNRTYYLLDMNGFFKLSNTEALRYIKVFNEFVEASALENEQKAALINANYILSGFKEPDEDILNILKNSIADRVVSTIMQMVDRIQNIKTERDDNKFADVIGEIQKEMIRLQAKQAEEQVLYPNKPSELHHYRNNNIKRDIYYVEYPVWRILSVDGLPIDWQNKHDILVPNGIFHYTNVKFIATYKMYNRGARIDRFQILTNGTDLKHPHRYSDGAFCFGEYTTKYHKTFSSLESEVFHLITLMSNINTESLATTRYFADPAAKALQILKTKENIDYNPNFVVTEFKKHFCKQKSFSVNMQ